MAGAAAQPVGEHVAGHAEAALEVVEPAQPGRKRALVVGLSLFILASAACAAAPSAAVLIAARVRQGAGAAILTPSSLGEAGLIGVVVCHHR